MLWSISYFELWKDPVFSACHRFSQKWQLLTLMNKFQWSSIISIEENACENIICIKSTILSQPQCDKWSIVFQSTEVIAERRTDGEKIRLKITMTAVVKPNSDVWVQIVNILMRRLLKCQQYVQVGRHFFDPNAANSKKVMVSVFVGKHESQEVQLLVNGYWRYDTKYVSSEWKGD